MSTIRKITSGCFRNFLFSHLTRSTRTSRLQITNGREMGTKVAVCQMNATSNLEENFKQVKILVSQAKDQNAAVGHCYINYQLVDLVDYPHRLSSCRSAAISSERIDNKRWTSPNTFRPATCSIASGAWPGRITFGSPWEDYTKESEKRTRSTIATSSSMDREKRWRNIGSCICSMWTLQSSSLGNRISLRLVLGSSRQLILLLVRWDFK